MSEYLLDTNVLSKVFTGNTAARQYISTLTAFIDATIYIECLQGSKSKREKQVIEKYLLRFPVLPLTPEISFRAIELIRRYSNTHGLFLPDALIAATTLENNLTLVTYNLRDFRFIADLQCIAPPGQTL